MATFNSNTQQKTLLRFIFLIITIVFVANPLIVLSKIEGGAMLDLVHRDCLPGRQHLTQAERIEQMLQRDMIRMQMIQKHHEHVGPARRQTQESKTAEMSMVSGYEYLVGEYVVEIAIGTPARKFLVVADTGSDVTWLDCNNSVTGFFNATKSTSFEDITCSSSTCNDDLKTEYQSKCSATNNLCDYNMSYTGGSVLGNFANETVTFGLTDGTSRSVKQMMIGCTNSRHDLDSILKEGLNGVMGLGNNIWSLLSQAYELFGGKFSYCLVDFQSNKTTSSKLFLGSSPSQGTPILNGPMQSTKLELNKTLTGSFYGVHIQNISIGGNSTEIPAETLDFTAGGGTIVDSGMTFTSLVYSAYVPVMQALNSSLTDRFKQIIPPEDVPFEYCYKMSGSGDYSRAPKMEIRFVDGAKLVVPGKNYLTDVADGVKCLAFTSVESGYNVIGNLLQQSHNWEFDIEGAILKFASSNCTSY